MKKRGAINFVKHKIQSKNHPGHIAKTLSLMGYSHIEISEIFIEAGNSIETLHQELVAGNDFLPTLDENLEEYFKKDNIKIFQKTIVDRLNPMESLRFTRVLAPYPAPAPVAVDLMRQSKTMSVTRHVFTYRLLLSLSILVLGIVAAYVSIKSVGSLYSFADPGSMRGMLGLSVIIIFGLYIFQLVSHRLHNAGISPWLSLLVFAPFLSGVPGLSQGDQNLLLSLFGIPAICVLILAMLTPSHKYKL